MLIMRSRLEQCKGKSVVLILSGGEKIMGRIIIPSDTADFDEVVVEERTPDPSKRLLTYVRISHIIAISIHMKKNEED